MKEIGVNIIKNHNVVSLNKEKDRTYLTIINNETEENNKIYFRKRI